MIEYTHRGIVIEQRGNVHRVPRLDRDFPHETVACKAIDVALEDGIATCRRLFRTRVMPVPYDPGAEIRARLGKGAA